MSMLLQDIRYALRLFGRNPAFTLVALLTLALGIGVTTALFSVVDAVLLRPLPYADPGQLVMVRAEGPHGTAEPSLSDAEIQDLREASRLFDQVAGIVAVGGSLTSESGDVEMERVTAANATDNFLPMLGIHPALGRLLDERIDTSSDAVLSVLISHQLWQRRYAGDPDVIGRAHRSQQPARDGGRRRTARLQAVSRQGYERARGDWSGCAPRRFLRST